MKNKSLKIGLIGTGVTALCCFTPILVITFAGLGASAYVTYLDPLLFPLLGFFMVLTAYGIYRSRAKGAGRKEGEADAGD